MGHNDDVSPSFSTKFGIESKFSQEIPYIISFENLSSSLSFGSYRSTCTSNIVFGIKCTENGSVDLDSTAIMAHNLFPFHSI